MRANRSDTSTPSAAAMPLQRCDRWRPVCPRSSWLRKLSLTLRPLRRRLSQRLSARAPERAQLCARRVGRRQTALGGPPSSTEMRARSQSLQNIFSEPTTATAREPRHVRTRCAPARSRAARSARPRAARPRTGLDAASPSSASRAPSASSPSRRSTAAEQARPCRMHTCRAGRRGRARPMRWALSYWSQNRGRHTIGRPWWRVSVTVLLPAWVMTRSTRGRMAGCGTSSSPHMFGASSISSCCGPLLTMTRWGEPPRTSTSRLISPTSADPRLPRLRYRSRPVAPPGGARAPRTAVRLRGRSRRGGTTWAERAGAGVVGLWRVHVRGRATATRG